MKEKLKKIGIGILVGVLICGNSSYASIGVKAQVQQDSATGNGIGEENQGSVTGGAIVEGNQESVTGTSEIGEKNEETVTGSALYSGSYKETKWTIYESGLLEVTGTGEMYEAPKENENKNKTPWSAYADSITNAKIEVTGANNLSYLFAGLKNLDEVDLSRLDTSKATTMERMYCVK